MKTLAINDLVADKELDREAMAEISGGNSSLWGGYGGVDILSPDLYNMVTPIVGLAEVPTYQENNLAQADVTYATNGYGINFVSNNKFASQMNWNDISGFLNPRVGSGR